VGAKQKNTHNIFYVDGAAMKDTVYFHSEKLKQVSKYISNQIYSAVSVTLTPAAG